MRSVPAWASLLAAAAILARAGDAGEAGPSANVPTEGEILTLPEAIALALEDNRRVRTAALEVGKSEDKAAASRSRRLPSFSLNVLQSRLLETLDFTFEKGSLGTLPTSGDPVPPEDASIRTSPRLHTFVNAGVSQPLSQLYRIQMGVRVDQAGLEAEREKLRAERQAIQNEVERLYYSIVQTASAIGASEEALRSDRELLRVVSQHVAEQAALAQDALDVEARLASEEYKALTLGNALATQKEQLNDMMGRDVRTPFRAAPVPQPEPLEIDLEAAQGTALEHRPEVREARLRLRQAEYDRRISKAAYLPDVSLSFDYLAAPDIELLPDHLSSAGLLMSWEPFTWGRKKRDLSQKSRTVEQARLSVQETQNRILIEVNARFRTLQENRAYLKASGLLRDAARERARVSLNRFKQNAALLKDALQAQSQQAEAEDQYRQAELAIWTAIADFRKARGDE